jgi:NRPS condensation-like uncharacterized protein
MEYRAQIFDLTQWLYEATGFNDHQVHCEIGLGSPINESALRRAVELSFETIPILATKFVMNGGRPVWESLRRSDLVRAFVATENEAVFESARTYRILEDLGPQVRFCLLRGSRNGLAVTMNHMIADGAGFKEYLYMVCGTYSRLLAEPRLAALSALGGDRGLSEVLRGFGPLAKVAALFGAGGDNNIRGNFAFPLEDGGVPKPFIAIRTVDREKVALLRKHCGERGSTLNDAALAAFYRVLARHLGAPALKSLDIPIMIDMRRYLRQKEFLSLRNLTSTSITRIRQSPGESFEETLLNAKAEMDALKRRGIGLGGFVKLSLMFSLLGEREAFRRLGHGLRNPLICMTNIGELDSKRLAFEGTRVESAYICGSIKHKPHFQLALSGFDGTLTLSSNLYGSEKDLKKIEAFLGEIEEELTVLRRYPPGH